MARGMYYRPNPSKGKGTSSIFYMDHENNEKKAMAIFNTTGNLRLNGDTGVGKSTFVHYLTDKNKWTDPFEYSLNTDSTRWDLIAQDILKGAQTEIRRGLVLDWLMFNPQGDDRAVLFLDEFNYAQPNVTTLMNQLCDDRRSIYVPELANSPILAEIRNGMKSGTVPTWTKDGEPKGLLDPTRLDEPLLHRSPKHYVVIAMNPAEKAGYTGAGVMNIAQLRRFESLELQYLEPKYEEQVLMNRVPELASGTKGREVAVKLTMMANGTRILYKRSIIDSPLTTGNLVNYAKMMMREGLNEAQIGFIMASMYPHTQRNIVLKMWTKDAKTADILKKYEERGGLEEDEEEM